MDSAVRQILDGVWKDAGGDLVVRISDLRITWKDQEQLRTEIRRIDNRSFQMTLDDEIYDAKLDGDSLTWSDGEVWRKGDARDADTWKSCIESEEVADNDSVAGNASVTGSCSVAGTCGSRGVNFFLDLEPEQEEVVAIATPAQPAWQRFVLTPADSSPRGGLNVLRVDRGRSFSPKPEQRRAYSPSPSKSIREAIVNEARKQSTSPSPSHLRSNGTGTRPERRRMGTIQLQGKSPTVSEPTARRERKRMGTILPLKMQQLKLPIGNRDLNQDARESSPPPSPKWAMVSPSRRARTNSIVEGMASPRADRRRELQSHGGANASLSMPAFEFQIKWTKVELSPVQNKVLGLDLRSQPSAHKLATIMENRPEVSKTTLDILEEAMSALQRHSSHKTQLLCTGGACSVDGHPLQFTGALGAALWGLARCARIECPAVRVCAADCTRAFPPLQETPVYVEPKLERVDGMLTLVEQEPVFPLAHQTHICAAVMQRSVEIDALDLSGESEVALRGGKAFVPRLTAWQPTVTDPFEINGLCLVSGGNGGIGGALTRFLVEKGAEHIALCSRSAKGTSSTWPGSCTEITTHCCDVSDAEQVNTVCKDLLDEYPDLDSMLVFHLAGVFADVPAKTQTRKDLERVWLPKVDGAVNLHRALRGLPSVKMVLFSSASACFGYQGHAGFAAANAALDALAQHWPNSCSIQWGPWVEVGMAKEGMLKSFDKRGIGGLSNTLAFQALASVLSECKTPLLTVCPISWPTFERFYGRASKLYAELAKSQSSLITSGSKRSHSLPRADLNCNIRILMMVNGTRGDAQPFIVFGKELKKRRYTIKILTNVDQVGFCHEHDLDAVAVYADCSEVITMMGGMEGTNFLDGAVKAKEAAKAWLKEHPGACRAVDDEIEDYRPDLILFSAQSSGPAVQYESIRHAPAIAVFLFRESVKIFMDHVVKEPARPTLLATSPVLDTEPLPDEANSLHQIGAFVMDEPPPDDVLLVRYGSLVEFLNRPAPQPVCIGWGSMLAIGASPEQMLMLALEALQLGQWRGVIIGGTAKLDVVFEELCKKTLNDDDNEGGSAKALLEYGRQNCCFVREAPHSWLYRQCLCVVHHGGSGTTHTALRCGKPAVVTPVFMDQFELAQAIHTLGCGVGFDHNSPLSVISPQRLAAAITEACGMSARALEVSKMLQDEASRSVRRATDIIEHFINDEVRSGCFEQTSRELHQLRLSASK